MKKSAGPPNGGPVLVSNRKTAGRQPAAKPLQRMTRDPAASERLRRISIRARQLPSATAIKLRQACLGLAVNSAARPSDNPLHSVAYFRRPGSGICGLSRRRHCRRPEFRIQSSARNSRIMEFISSGTCQWAKWLEFPMSKSFAPGISSAIRFVCTSSMASS